MVKVREALKRGSPLSVTRAVSVLVAGAWATVGVQLKAPVVGSMPAPAGAPASRLYCRLWPASTSAPTAVKLTVSPAWVVRLAKVARVGAWLITLGAPGVGGMKKMGAAASGKRPWLVSLSCAPKTTLSMVLPLGPQRPSSSPSFLRLKLACRLSALLLPTLSAQMKRKAPGAMVVP